MPYLARSPLGPGETGSAHGAEAIKTDAEMIQAFATAVLGLEKDQNIADAIQAVDPDAAASYRVSRAEQFQSLGAATAASYAPNLAASLMIGAGIRKPQM